MTKAIKIKNLELNNNQLKIIAMISMLIDHIGFLFFPKTVVFRIIGRVAFPIFAYMIAEGCRHTKNRKRYLGTIAILAILFQLVYFVFIGELYQCILYTFSISIATIFSIEGIINGEGKRRTLMKLSLACAILVGVGFPLIFSEQGFFVDYGVWGIFLPVIVYFAPSKSSKLIFTALLIAAMALISDPLQWWALFAIPFLALYNGKRGRANLKYLFYIFYPAHLILLFAIYLIIYALFK